MAYMECVYIIYLREPFHQSVRVFFPSSRVSNEASTMHAHMAVVTGHYPHWLRIRSFTTSSTDLTDT